MLKILVVEDDSEKLRRVLKVLEEVPGCNGDSIENVRDAASAKRCLKEKQYDLLILDIALPEKPDALPSREGGITLLEELIQREIYCKPRHIVGLTAYSEILEKAGPRFEEDLWLVILYEPSSDTWAVQLQNKIRHILLAGRSGIEVKGYEAYLCVITALADPELQAVLSLPWNWESIEKPNDPTPYFKGQFLKEGVMNQVVAAATPRMGMPLAAALTMKMVAAFRPRYLAITGILAGVPGRCELGDIIITDPGWDYGCGKFTVGEGGGTFLPDPYQISLDSFIRGKFARMAQDQALLDKIRRSYTGKKPETVLRMHRGPVASGASVIANPDFLDAIKLQQRKLLAVEMETYGVLASAVETPLPQPKAFSIKSVCDFANEKKDDQYQHYAAYSSAEALRMFVERYL